MQLTMELTLVDWRTHEPLVEAARGPLRYSTQPGWELARGIDERKLLNELLRAGETREFDAVLASMSERAHHTRIPMHLYYAEAIRATRELTRTAGPETEECINAAARLGARLGVPEVDGQHVLHTFVLRLQQGRSRELAIGIPAVADDPPPVAAGTSLLCIALARAGRHDEARQILDTTVAESAALHPDNFRIGALAFFAGAAARCGSADQRRVLADALEPYANQLLVFGTLGAVLGSGHHWLGELARAAGDEALAHEHFRAAADFCYNADVPYWYRHAIERGAPVGA
jgi:hypothetical protein